MAISNPPNANSTSFGPLGIIGETADGWQQRAIIVGAGTPEAVVAGDPGALFWDATNSILYHKASGYAKTGWSSASSQGAVTGTTAAFTGNASVGGSLTLSGGTTSNGATLVVQELHATTTTSSGATTQSLGALPNGIVLGVVLNVTTAITGPGASFSVGDATTADKWGTGILLAAGTTTTTASFKTKTAATAYSAGELLTLTSNTGNFTTGAVSSIVYYISLTAPTT